MKRHVDLCTHRNLIDPADPDVAACKIIDLVIRSEDVSLSRVRRDLCEACCESFAPTPHELNPPVASAVFNLSRAIIVRGGVRGCSVETAAALAEWAEESLAAGFGVPAELPETEAAPPCSRLEAERPAGRVRVGLVGWNTPTGLGAMNRDIAKHLGVDRWLIPAHPFFHEAPRLVECQVFYDVTPRGIDAFLDGLDWLLFVEHPYGATVVPAARAHNVRIAFVPMWEYLDEFLPWLQTVDLVICPTLACYQMMQRWRERLDRAWEIAFVPWPIDPDAFPFGLRTECRRFLFVNGTGGEALSRDRPKWDGRKGAAIVAEAARIAPEIPVLVRSQTECLPPFPSHVEIRVEDVPHAQALYEDGDVCIQPSRWEGLGLPLLECQASGLPLVTTDAPPMNECRPWRMLESSATRFQLFGSRRILAHEVAPGAVAKVMRELFGADLTDASLAARRYVEMERSWPAAAPRIRALMS